MYSLYISPFSMNKSYPAEQLRLAMKTSTKLDHAIVLVVIILMWPYISVKLIKIYFLYSKVYCIFDTNYILLILKVEYAMQGFCRYIYFCVQLKVSVPSLKFNNYSYENWFCPYVIQYEFRINFLQPTRLLSCSFSVLFKVLILLYEWPSPLISHSMSR